MLLSLIAIPIQESHMGCQALKKTKLQMRPVSLNTNAKKVVEKSN